MMKNRAGWLALLVLGFATILMVFFVLPRITEDPEPSGSEQTPSKSADTAPVTSAVTEATEKMARLKEEASNAVKGLASLFADSQLPTADAYAGARAVAETSVSALAAINIPDDIEKTAGAAMTATRAGAQKALSVLKALPSEPEAAAPLIGLIEKALDGMDVDVPASEGSSASTDQAPAVSAEVFPEFDVLRVEPDGSTVIAGRSLPDSQVDVVDGDTVIATDKAGESGDFVAVTENPLPPGDYALSLRATTKDGKVVTSKQVATVSVPKDASGNLLAMITTPGQASKVLTMPDQVAESTKQPRVAEQSTEAPAPAETAATAEPAETAELPPSTTTTEPAFASSGDGQAIRVTAVEIEDEKIFIAGATKKGGTVRAYADETFVGDASADAGGNFVVEGKMSLSVGSHTIRVDLIDENGNVIVRASVPFERPEGSQVSVVAKAPDAESGQPDALVPLEEGAFEKQRDALSKSFAILRSLYVDGKQPTMEALAAARSATSFSLKSLSEFRPSTNAGEQIAANIAKTAKAAGKALDTLQALPQDVAAVGAALPDLAKLIDDVLNAAPTPTQAPAAIASGTDAASGAQVQTAAGEPATIEQAPLTKSANSVIIRRGDTLWQISRRIYGQGVRYTTIYLANEGQILNPDLIEPGQIFTIPDSALPENEAEDIHRRRLRGEKPGN